MLYCEGERHWMEAHVCSLGGCGGQFIFTQCSSSSILIPPRKYKSPPGICSSQPKELP